MRLDLSIYGEDQLSRELLRFSNYVGDPSPAFHKIADDMRKSIAHTFEAEGPGWKPLAESTLAQKAAKGLPPDILHATGHLLASLTQKGGDHIEEITDSSLRFGSKDPVGIFHQKGTRRMPQRKVVNFSELDRRGFLRTLQRYITTGQVA